ncbi:MAG: hypothetical protein HKO59_15295, partial [Phycisphaerales bacterium]|nr:hypothetical protein [Phycisphaerales bacterium]
MNIHVDVSPPRLVRRLAAGAAVLVGLGLIVAFVRPRVTHGYAVRWLSLFDLDAEWNVASWYAVLLLLLAATLLALAAAVSRRREERERRFTRHWAILAMIFVYLALDEGVGLHELLTRPMQSLVGGTGWLHFAWVIPFAALAAVLLLVYLPFLAHLPRATAVRFVVAGALYVGGAIGMELVGGATLDRPAVYPFIAVLEEGMELTGLVVFIAAIA